MSQVGEGISSEVQQQLAFENSKLAGFRKGRAFELNLRVAVVLVMVQCQCLEIFQVREIREDIVWVVKVAGILQN